jgi:hypothetical protein
LAGALEQDEGAVRFLAVFEGGGERKDEDEDENGEEEIAALAGGKGHWRLASEFSGEDGEFWMWRLRIACIDCVGRIIFRHVSLANSQDISKDPMTATQALEVLAAAMLRTAHPRNIMALVSHPLAVVHNISNSLRYWPFREIQAVVTGLIINARNKIH